MSRIIQQIATVQFQVDNRKVTASMDALQEKAKSLNMEIDGVNLGIKNLGDVAPDDKNLLAYQKHLRQLNSDLRDVQAAQRDLMKGVKAADQLWKAAASQDIEGLSIKAIKAGQNGLRKRMENLRPELGGDDAKMYDAYKAVIEEADRVIKVFQADATSVVQVIRDGGIVSEQVMKRTRDSLKELMEAEKEGTTEQRQLAQQYDFLNESLTNVAEMRRREKGEIVNANDARREALKLTEDGIAAARRERDMADAVIAGMEQEKSNLEQKRKLVDENIAQTEREIAANQRLEEAEQERLADVEKAMRYTENEDRKEAIRLRKKADAARDDAEAKKEAYEEQAEQENLLRQHVKDTGDEVANLTAKIEALGKTEAKPKVDTSEIDGLKAKLEDLKKKKAELDNTILTQTEIGDKAFAEYEELSKLPTPRDVMKKYEQAYAKFSDKMKSSLEALPQDHFIPYNGNDTIGAEDIRMISRHSVSETDFKAAVQRSLGNPRAYLYERAASFNDQGKSMSLDDLKFNLEQMKKLQEEYKKVLKDTDWKKSLYNEDGQSKQGIQAAIDYYKTLIKEYEAVIKQIETLEAKYKAALETPDNSEKIYELSQKSTDAHNAVVTAIKERVKVSNDITETETKIAEAEEQSTTATNDQTEAIKKQEEELGKLKHEADVVASAIAQLEERLKQLKSPDSAIKPITVENALAGRLGVSEGELKISRALNNIRSDAFADGDEATVRAFLRAKGFTGIYDKDSMSDYRSVSKKDMISQLTEYIGNRFSGYDVSDDTYGIASGGKYHDMDWLEEVTEKERKKFIELSYEKQKAWVERVIKKQFGEIDAILYQGADDSSAYVGKGDSALTGLRSVMNAEVWKGGKSEDPATQAELDAQQKLITTTKELIQQNDELAKTEHQLEVAKKAKLEIDEKIAQAQQESAQADQQSADVTKQKAELEGQLEEKTKAHTKAVSDYEAQQEKSNKAQEKAYKAQEESVALNEKAAAAEEKVAHQEEEHNKAMDHQSEHLRQIRAEGERLLKQWEQQKNELQAVDKAWADADVKQGEAEARKAQNQELTIKSLDDSIRKLKEANSVIDTNSDEWEENTRIIQRLQAALDEMKNKPALLMMTERMGDVSKLSTAAVTETKRFWEQMVAGAERGSKELAEYEAHLKTITEEEQKRKTEQVRGQAYRVKTGLFTTMDENELRESINAAREYQKTLMVGSSLYNEYSEAIAKAEKHLRDNSVETERAKLSQQEMNNVMRQQLDQGTALTESALKAQENYWRRLIDDPKTAAKSLDLYKANLKEVHDLQQQQANELRDTRAARLDSPGNFSNLSEQEIREAIEAGKQLIQTYETGDARAKTLGENIVRAEEHLKQYGLEAARTAQREIQSAENAAKKLEETHQAMEQQLRRGTGLTESALKTQENYWRRMADDPKAASNEIARYFENLNKVHEIQKEQEADLIKGKGVAALQFFRNTENVENATGAQIQEHAKALKAFRDSLPQKDKADVIAEIDGYLQKAGASAKKATEELMDFDRAKEIAMQAGEDIYGKKGPAFMASPEEIQAATKSIQKYREELFKTIKAKRDSGEATDAEEKELKELAKYLKDLKFEQDNFNMSREKMETLMKTPVSAANLDELRAAIKRADDELRRMEGSLGDNSDEYKDFAKQVKNAKGVLKEMEGQAKATTSAFEKAWSRLKTYVGLYVGASVAMQKLTATMGDLIDLSDKMGEVRKTTGFTADEVGHLTEELKKMDTRTAITGLLDLSVAAGQLGLKTQEDVQGFTEAANKLMVALPEMGREGATEMLKVALATGEITKIEKEMREGLIDGSSATAIAMEKIGSTIDRLRATSAATAPAITDFVKRVGAVGAQSGITIDQVAALGSTVDALGMRVEMSATALSRMIPAIKNNAFALAQAIGVTPVTIRNLFDTGRGMEVILMVLQRIKDSGMDADSIEQMLGMAGMKDIMKDLNQQGARAGIVFAGLSQNVDTLRKHLVTANEAYEENIAIQNEYDKMNETTAARWERLKNRIEEAFVGDRSQRVLGWIIDRLRDVVDLLVGDSGVSVALKTIIVYLGLVRLRLLSIATGALKAVWAGLKNIVFMLGVVKGEMTAMQWGNIFTAAAGAVLYLVMALKDAVTVTSAVSKAIADLSKELQKETETVDGLFHAVNKTNVELDKAKARLEEVKKAGEDTTKAENSLKKASADHAAAIREINSKYGTYLGYMLSETSSAQQLAAARELINSKLRETITLKQREAALGNVEQEFGGKVNKRAASMEDTLQYFFGRDYDAAARVSVAISEAANKYAKDSKAFQKEVTNILANNGISQEVSGSYMKTFEEYRSSIEKYMNQEDVINRRFDAQIKVAHTESREKTVATLRAIRKDWVDLLGQYQDAEGEEKKELAAEVYKQQRSYANVFSNNAGYFNEMEKEAFDNNIKEMTKREKELRSVAGEAIRTIDAMERAETKVTNTDFTNDGNSANNPWGTPLSGESTDWKNMTAEQLVNRRKQMNDFVNAIQTDTDVQSVLNEDAALKKAIENGMASDMRTVIEWYNTERLKIQDELHARHLTNTGDWLDPKKERARKKQLQDEWSMYLKEIDAYYTERKTRIQEAGTEEGITEAEVRNRTLANEMEWYQRRAELQKLYAEKSEEVSKEEQQAIFNIISERTGEGADLVEMTIAKTVDFMKEIGKRSPNELKNALATLGLGWERDFLKQQRAVTQQMKAIQDIIDRERPFNGITKNLRENLATMGILTADMTRERNELMKQGADMTKFNNRQSTEELKRTAFMLGEAENAYSTTVENVMRRMADKGMTAWAEELKQNPQMQEGLMAQLRSTYDAIQDAIKKEASQLKKQAEIMWNNILLPGGDGKTTIKDAFERTISQLGIDQGRVSRANSLIGAGQASERVADRLAIQQMKVQLAMQEHYYNLMQKRGEATVRNLEAEAEAAKKLGNMQEYEQKMLDAKHARMSLNLATAKEETELAKQREDIIARTEESQNRLYTELRSWVDLLSSSLQSVFEASNAGNREYYNERAKLDLTGSGGPGAGTYMVIDNEGTSSARAHYEYLDERAALERQREIEQQNALADAWRKVMDDINMKLSETITDQLNAMLQNESIDMNTNATLQNTEALTGLTNAIAGGSNSIAAYGTGGAVVQNEALSPEGVQEWTDALGTEPWRVWEEAGVNAAQGVTQATRDASNSIAAYGTGGAVVQNEALSPEGVQEWTDALGTEPWRVWEEAGVNAAQGVTQATRDASKEMQTSTQSAFAKMTQAANLYGIAYQAMSNENMSAAQKFEMIAIQAAGQAAITSLTASGVKMVGDTAIQTPSVLSKIMAELGPIAGPVAFGAFTALLGGLMGLATSKLTKAKSQISSITGSSIGAGRLATGMQTYAEGNVNEFTDPQSLTPGRQYNVDAADGRTYRARYMGKNPRTHLTNGPEFHLAGEKGREMIIDAGTTRQITMDDNSIWRTIQTLSGGGRRYARRRNAGHGGVAAFADGNMEDFEGMMGSDGIAANGTGMSMEMAAALQSSIDRQSELLERALTDGIKGVFDIYGRGGLVDSYDRGKMSLNRHGEKR